jgi:hypothetical protein
LAQNSGWAPFRLNDTEGVYFSILYNNHYDVVLSTNSRLHTSNSRNILLNNTHPTIGTSGVYFMGNNSTKTNNIYFFSHDKGTADQDIGTVEDNTKMIITNAGNVGIGTITPLEKLHVNGNIQGNGFKIGNGFNITGRTTLYLNSSSASYPVDIHFG